jgi:hypothetical protein
VGSDRNPTSIFEATTVDSQGNHYIREHGLALSENGKTLFAVYFSGETMLSAPAVP